MPPATASHGTYYPPQFNPFQQPSFNSSTSGGYPHVPSPPDHPFGHAMSLTPLSALSSPSAQNFPEDANLLQATNSSNNIGEAFMDLDDDEDDDEPSHASHRPPPGHIPSPLSRSLSPHHPPSSFSPPPNIPPSLTQYQHSSNDIHQHNTQRSPPRRVPSYTSSGMASRPVSYAPSDEVLLGLGLGQKPSEMPSLDKNAHLILYNLPSKRLPSKLSTPSGSMRGPIAYAYDPSTDMNRPVDDEDRLHDPNARGLHDHSFPWRGVVNVATLILLLLGMMTLFLFYPIYTHYGDVNRFEQMQEIIDTDGMSKPYLSLSTSIF